ncbi:MAG TPA: hypothetical protein VHM91_03080 [Verrucomicrobiales bacterium]|jgi:hypothetical protein|nr:hypothetical protein [Verrucomicrobiales bacterium]
MKNNRFTLSMAGVAALVTMALGQVSGAAEKEKSCASEAKKVTAAVSETPDKVLEIVAKEVQAAPTCVCEIVKSAIKASKADKDLVVQIVTTASTISPDETPTIIECAIAASPESARAIAEKFGSGKGVAHTGKEPSGKEPTGKGTPPTDEEYSNDFGLFHIGVGGIYLTTPSSGLSNGGFLPPVNQN